jgi:translocation and assembly module TamA
LGTLVGASVDNVPGADRFFSGGGGAVRGYAFQAIGPFDANDVPLGGRSLAEASIEGRARVTDTIGVVAFLDAGSVSDTEYPTFDNLRVGAGLGVRYMTPAGPIRFDIATPLNPSDRDEAIQVYISIGQAF